jgi:hypothetical protein
MRPRYEAGPRGPRFSASAAQIPATFSGADHTNGVPMRMPRGSGETPAVGPEEALVSHLRTLLQLRQWTEARTVARELATQYPRTSHYRALLALARGYEASQANEPKRAREEWRRAITLDPKLEEARAALSSRAARRSWVDRLFKR